jgi:hypothetical protein
MAWFPDNQFAREAFARDLLTMESALARVAGGSGAALIPSGAQT